MNATRDQGYDALGQAAPTLRVLLIEDSSVDAELTRRELKRGGIVADVRVAQTERDLRRALAEQPPQIILSDFALPGFDGTRALAIARELAPETPFLFVSGTIGEDNAVRALRDGATDYILKGNLARLCSAVRRALEEANERESRRQAEQRYREIFENSIEGIFQATRGGRLVACNPAHARTLGYESPDDLISAVNDVAAQLYVNSEDRVRLLGLLDKQGTVQGFEAQFRRKDGQVIWCSMSVRAVRAADGSISHILGMQQEITARVLAEQDLQRFRAAMDITVDSIYLTDPETMRFHYVNDSACRRLGYPREELLKKSPHEVIGKERAEIDREYAAVVAAGERGTSTESRFVRKDGSQGWTELHRRALVIEGRPLIVTIGRDITERKVAELALAESERRFRGLSELSSDFYWESDADHRMLRVSHGSQHKPVLGTTQVGKRRWESPSTYPDAAGWSAHRAMLDARQPFRDFELARIVGDGQERWLAISGEPVFDDSGAFRGYRGVGKDITERRAQQERIERLSRVYAVLSGINALIVRVHKRGELFKEACRIAVEAGKFPLAWVAVADRRDQRVTAAAWAGDEAGFVQLNRPTVGASGQGKPGLGAQAMEKRGPVVCNDIEADGSAMRYPEEALARGYRSAAALPLLVDGTAIAALVLYATEAGFFDDEETKLLAELASDISFALSQIKKARKLDRLTRVNAMLSGINGAIVRIRDREALFDEACRIAVETGGLRFAWLNLVDEVEMRLRPIASAGVVGGYLQTVPARLSLREDAPEGHGIAARSILQKRALAENDVETSAAVMFKNVYAEHGIRSMAAFPMFIAGRVAGNLVLHSPEAGFFDDDEMKLLSEVVGNIAFALEHIEKEEKVERLTRVYAVLSGINAAIVRIRDRKDLYREACRVAVEEGGFKMAWAGAVRCDAGRIEPIAWQGTDEGYIRAMPLELDAGGSGKAGLAAQAVRERKPVVSDDMAKDPHVVLRVQAEERGFHSLAILPLVEAGAVVGVLALYATEVGFFDAQEMKLLNELAGDVSFALEVIAKEEKLDYLALHDPLTGLANRALMVDRLGQSIQNAGLAGDKFAVAWIDLERLTTINESLGRYAGDALIRQVAERLTRAAGTASLSRVVGDHFVVLLPAVKGRSEAARVFANLSRTCFGDAYLLEGTEIKVAAKAGLALFPNDGADAETLLGNAEAALRKAKETGERHVFYTPDLTERTGVTLTLENQLRNALDKQEFVLHYQPKVESDARRIVGIEALIRWQSPELGLVPPGKFIPLMEETGMILDAGTWALKRAALDHRRWTEMGLRPPRLAVNVSAIQLRQKDFVEAVEQAILEGVAPTGIDLEITESLIMENIDSNIGKLREACALGVRVAIDDFGTGYSSLSYLAKLPVQTLKIDRSFVISMLDEPATMTLVQTIISLAHSLRLKVVAEGVDAEEQAKILTLLRCDEMQGYLFSKPVPFDELTMLLQKRGL